MQKVRVRMLMLFMILALLLLLPHPRAKADGTETLGPPSIAIASGSALIAAGTGLMDGEGMIDLTLPPNVTIKQVLLYWEGQMQTNVAGDNTARLNGSMIVNGTLIGGPTFFFSGTYSSAFRADITNLNLIKPGYNVLTVDDIVYSKITNGAGLLVIYEDGSGAAHVDLRDGLDLAFAFFQEPQRSTVLQTFTFPAAPVDRMATLTLFASSVAGTTSGGGARPESLEIIVAGQKTIFSNELNSWDGEEWDTKSNSVTVPAGVTALTVQLFSRDDLNTGNLPSSLTWLAAGLTLRTPAPQLELEKWTNGFDADDPNGTDVPVITPGAPVTWTYRVSNIGTLPFVESEIAVTDDLVGPVTQIVQRLGNMDDVLAPGETWIYQATGTALDLATATGVTIVQGCGKGQTTVTGPTYENIGTVIGTPMSGGTPITDSDPSHYCNSLPPAIDIEKATNGEDADTPTGPFILVNNPVTWTYVVVNTGVATLTNVTVTDDQGVIVSCPKTVLIPAESMTCTGNGVAVAGQYANMGTVVGTPPNGGPPVTDRDPSHYFGAAPAIVIKKYTNGEDADTPTGPKIPIDGAVTWTYIVTNTGNVTLSQVNVTDDKGVVVTCPKSVLLAQESMTCTGAGVAVEGQYANIGTVVGTPPVGPPVTSKDPSHYFGYRPASVGNRVFGDIDPDGATPTEIAGGDGIQDAGEIGIDGIIVQLYDATTNTLISETVTSNGGYYLFTNLPPGEYYIVFINPFPEGVWTLPNVGNNDEIDSDPVADPNLTDPRGEAQKTESFVLDSGEEDLNWDAGLVGLTSTASANVGDFVWFDLNKNGIQDAGENGFPGVTVRLFNADTNTLVRTTQTGSDGKYLFSGVDPGNYYIEFVIPPNFTISPQNAGADDEKDSDIDPNTKRTAVFALPSFVTDLRWDAGIFQTGTGLEPNTEPGAIRSFLPLIRTK